MDKRNLLTKKDKKNKKVKGLYNTEDVVKPVDIKYDIY